MPTHNPDNPADHNPADYGPEDGRKVLHDDYRIYFRGESRLVKDLTPREVQCALSDAHSDLNHVAIRLARVEFLLEKAPSSITTTNALQEVIGIERRAWRHQTSREDDEALNAKEADDGQ